MIIMLSSMIIMLRGMIILLSSMNFMLKDRPVEGGYRSAFSLHCGDQCSFLF